MNEEMTSATEIKRDTSIDLFNAVMSEARKAGALEAFDRIMDYSLATEYNSENKLPISHFAFNFEFIVDYGQSEGIYIDAYIHGEMDESGKTQRRHIGTIKTLECDFSGLKIMGETCGILQYYASKYVNANLDRYAPDPDKLGKIKPSDVPYRCQACHNVGSIRLATEPPAQASGFQRERLLLRCAICGGETNAHNTPVELIHAWRNGEFWIRSTQMILVSKAALQAICKKRLQKHCNQQCSKCQYGIIIEQRNIFPKEGVGNGAGN